jgi:Bacterial Ig-like domain (group 2)
MSLCSGRPTRTSNFQFALLAVTLALCCLSSSAQQPKVLAPHKPVSPRLPDSQPEAGSLVLRTLRGGYWMTDANTKSSVYVRNVVETSSISVTPVLYLSNGVKLSLPVVVLPPAGTAVIDINDALSNQGLAPYATLSGYIELQYQWAWDALCATVSSVDATHSTIFTYGLRPVGASGGSGAGTQNGPAPAGPHSIEGAWWKQETEATGFVVLSNTTEQPLPATVEVSDANASSLGVYQVTISPHGTKRVELQELSSSVNSLGGLYVAFSGTTDALIVNGGLEDPSKGYSASIPFGPPPDASAKTSTVSYAEIGLMTGQADPMMHFPAGTVFTPYSVLRNLNRQPVSITPALWWMTGGAAASVSLPKFSLAPLQTKLLDMPALLMAAGLKNFNGAVNLVLQFQGPPGSVIAASGSVDQSENYVFEVVPRGMGEGASKSLSYWSTANGDDTMVTLWNPADEAQDFVFTVFFAGGHYLYPIHLEPRATSMFNMSELIENQLPDSEGNVIPLSVREGSGKLSGSVAENQHILVAVDAGTYNVRKATCVFRCITCNGAVSFTVAANPFAVAVSGTLQMSMKDRWNTGSTYDVTSASDWSSSNTSVATVDQTALAHGISVGGATLSAFDYSEPLGGQDCNYYPSCANDMAVGGGGSAPGTVAPQILIGA